MTGKLTITCTEFRPYWRNTLRGFADLSIPEMRLTIHGVAVHEKNSSRWAQLPARPQVKDGALVKRADGKLEYAPILEFSDKQTRDAFSAAVIRAVLEHDRLAFENPEVPLPPPATPQASNKLSPGYPADYIGNGRISNKPKRDEPKTSLKNDRDLLNDEIPW
jgi:hypothetical protein